MRKLCKLSALLLVMVMGLLSSFNAQAQTSKSMIVELVKEIDNNLPEDAGFGIIWNKAAYSNNYIIFSFTVDETDIKMSDIEDNKSLFKEIYLDSFCGDIRQDRELSNLLIKANTGMKLDMRGLKSKKQCIITITPEEMSKALR